MGRFADPTAAADPAAAGLRRFFTGPDAARGVIEQTRRRQLRKSVLDDVLSEAGALIARVGRTEALKLDQYFTSVREAEVQLTAAPPAACSAGRPGDIDPNDFRAQFDAMMDLIILAFQCDLTRVVSFMCGPGHCAHVYDFLPGITDTHYSYSHHDNNPTN